jgi:hypothetical protein
MQSMPKEVTMNALTGRRFALDGFRRQDIQSRASSVLTRLLAVALATLVALPMAAATQPVAAGKKFKTITKTVSSTAPISVPGAGTSGPASLYPSTIDVTAFDKFKKAQVKDVNLTLLNLTHTFPDNIDVMLVLGNRQATVMSDVGGGTDASNLTLTLDDQATTALPDTTALSSGAFQPANFIGQGEVGDVFPAAAPAQNGAVALSTFNGANPGGQWQLFVNDDFNASSGSLAGGWSLQITAKVKEAREKKDHGHKKSADKVKDANAQQESKNKHRHSAR